MRGVTLRVGALSGVEVPALRFAFPEAAAGTLLEGAALLVEAVPAVAWCPSCCAERLLPSIQRIRCPVCRTPTPRIVRGRELEILAVEVEVPEALPPGTAADPAPLVPSPPEGGRGSG